jgi:DNA invertase Pin-like site-specific DNA recombinase
METPVRAVAYMRCSGQSQIAGDTWERQRAAIEKYAIENNLKIIQWFQDEGVSGKTEWENRPAWVDMIASLSPQMRTIVIERLDRLARDLGIQEFILRTLAQKKIILLSTAEPDLDSADPTRVMFRQIVGAVSQFERAMIEAKLRAARQRVKKKTGRCEGRYHYGHDPRRPQEKVVLDQMVAWSSVGYNYSEIRDKLNAAHISTRDGAAKWFSATVSRIIRRENALRS